MVGFDAANDLALLQIGNKATKAAPFGTAVKLGQNIIVLGYPLQGILADAIKVSTGVVGALSGPGNDRRLLQITAPIQPGNSGGPVIDVFGNVIGIVVSKLDAAKILDATGNIPENVNFAIRFEIAKLFLESHGIAVRPPNQTPLSTAEITRLAREWTVLLECR